MNNHAYTIEKDPIAVVMDPAAVQIVFVGSKTQFPDCLSRMIAAEIDGTTTQRMVAPADLGTAMAQAGFQPQLVIVDDSLWPAMDADVLAAITANPATSVAIAFRDVSRINHILMAEQGVPKGISFLPMDLNIESWLTILRLLLTGYPFVPSEVMLAMDAISKRATPPAPTTDAPADDLDKLTPRERQVLALVAEGYQNKHIADKLELSEHTVKLHLHHVISKLGARNRTDAALRYRRHTGA